MDIEPRKKKSVYPEPFASRMNGRTKRQLGEFFGLKKFGVNLTTIEPNGESALMHIHSKQEEFIYVISGNPTLVTNVGEWVLSPGECVGFKPNDSAHKLMNNTDHEVVYLEIGDREAGDEVFYPEDDLVAKMDESKNWVFTNKKGERY